MLEYRLSNQHKLLKLRLLLGLLSFQSFSDEYGVRQQRETHQVFRLTITEEIDYF